MILYSVVHCVNSIGRGNSTWISDGIVLKLSLGTTQYWGPLSLGTLVSNTGALNHWELFLVPIGPLMGDACIAEARARSTTVAVWRRQHLLEKAATKVRIIAPQVWCTCSMIPVLWGFAEVIGFYWVPVPALASRFWNSNSPTHMLSGTLQMHFEYVQVQVKGVRSGQGTYAFKLNIYFTIVCVFKRQKWRQTVATCTLL